MKILDCKGLACPGPVLRCKEAIEKTSPEHIKVIVDNKAAQENVKRFLLAKGYEIDSLEDVDKDSFTVIATRGEVNLQQTEKEEDMSLYSCSIPSKSEEKILVFITSRVLGKGDDELGKKLMENFIKTLPELGGDLWRIIMLNSAVELATSPGPILDTLKQLEKTGVSILVCGTCLDFFGLLEKKEVGETTNMLDVVTSLQMASKIIKI